MLCRRVQICTPQTTYSQIFTKQVPDSTPPPSVLISRCFIDLLLKIYQFLIANDHSRSDATARTKSIRGGSPKLLIYNTRRIIKNVRSSNNFVFKFAAICFVPQISAAYMECWHQMQPLTHESTRGGPPILLIYNTTRIIKQIYRNEFLCL